SDPPEDITGQFYDNELELARIFEPEKSTKSDE
ncbi:unnamed protein product, partial [Allacma fusca]